ncbi:sugar transporter-like protein [Rhodotorula toruloides]|uniref:RHTO0S19e01882g1_1 n=2 Tax=Rhodotorula toruloides TaxID=5286 RepID=A0A061BL17_RHOTO|nr:MFS monosaccharide transporter [Rhodotorula toruloides NP11]EMS20151.1 MFS monosaccharide transporter [Rhodotorula toruloides NP11]CDR48661.1 RHTO0S19e01882g1_1 [Rhodotorula toruloides]
MSVADQHLHLKEKGEKREFAHNSPAPSREGSTKPGWNGVASLPEGTPVNADGVPTYMGTSGNKLGALVTLAASMASATFSPLPASPRLTSHLSSCRYDQGVMSGLISAPQFISVFPACDAAVQGAYKASVLQAFYVAIYEVGCLGGAIFALMFGDRLGRRRMMYIGAFVLLLGVLIQVTAFRGHWAGGQFVIGRIVTGLGTGFETSTIPTWHAECAKAHSRGFAVFIEAAMISTGTMIAYWIDFGFSYLPDSTSWRVPIALQAIFAVALVALIAFLPESPRWLVSKGHYVEAQRVIAALEPAHFTDETVLLQLKIIGDSLEGQTRQRKRDLITNGPTQHFRRALLGSSSQFFQQVGGCNAVIYFSTPIFEEYLGLGRKLSLILGSVLATVYALSACISFPLVDKAGRRKLYFIGTWGQALSMFLIMACLIPDKSTGASKGAVVGIFLYLTFFGFTWLELPWLYPAEINPLKTRTVANAVSTINNWLWNFTVVMFTPPFLASTAVGTFAFFGAINLCFLPIIWYFYPETAGRSLEEIDLVFAKGYVEGVSYVKMANDMPKMGPKEVQAEWARLGLDPEDELPTRPSDAERAIGGESIGGTTAANAQV